MERDLVSNQYLQSSSTAALGEERGRELPDEPVPEVTISRQENGAFLNFVQALRLKPFEIDHHKGVPETYRHSVLPSLLRFLIDPDLVRNELLRNLLQN